MPTQTTFNCLIEATRDNESVYYFATVEDDGFIYFNDDTFFRVETPQNIHDIEQPGTTITITVGIQRWYVVRDVWVYANVFDSLTLSMIHESDIDKQDLQNGLDTIVGYVNDVGSEAIGTNGDVLYQLILYIQSLIQDLGNQGISTPTLPSFTLYTTWTNKQNYTLQ